MAESALAKKMKLKPGHRAALVTAPQNYLKELRPLPSGTQMADRLTGKFDWVQVFVRDKAELEKVIPRLTRAVNPDGIVWISFPKGTSRIQTDLTRDKGWEGLEHVALKWITLISVNETWSAFALRPYKPSEERQPFR
jgi:hypothetical protein